MPGQSQISAEVTQLRTRLARLEKLFDTLAHNVAAGMQNAQLVRNDNSGVSYDVTAKFRLTVTANAATAPGYTITGRGILQYDTGTAWADVPGATEEVLCNDHTTGFLAATNTIVQCELYGGKWFIDDVNKCTSFA